MPTVSKPVKPVKARIKRWVEALRSGDYKQGRGRLKYRDGYCCLGVLCDISGVGQWKGAVYKSVSGDEKEVMPTSVAEWAGLRKQDPRLGKGEYRRGAAQFNDSGSSFTDIADLIEAEYLKPNPKRAKEF